MTIQLPMRTLILLLAASPVLPAQSVAHDIVRRATEAEANNWKMARKYIFSERVNLKYLDAHGQLEKEEVKAHDVMLLDGSPYRRLVARDDRALTTEEERKEQEKLTKTLSERRKETVVQRARRIGDYGDRPEWQREAWRDLLDAFDFRQVADDVRNGRMVYVIEGVPRRGFQPRSRTAKAMLHLNCKLWIDKQDFNLVKAEVEAIDNIWIGYFLVRVAKGTHAGYEQSRVNDEVWMASQVQASISARVGLFKVVRLQHEVSYSKCHEFQPDQPIISQMKPGSR
jgi:hypothetical protein